MNSNFLNLVADVLDKMAAVEAARPATLVAPISVKAAAAPEPEVEPEFEDDGTDDGEKRASDAYTTITGKAPDATMRQKLAEDPELLEGLQKIADEARRPDRMGGPSTRPGYTPMAKTAEERRQAAWDRMGAATINE